MAWCCSCFTKTYEAPEVLELDYRHNSLNEVPPDVFTYERTLEKLDLGCNQISDLPPSLFHCHELKELDLCDNDLMTIPPAIGSLTRLVHLDLSRNAIADIADTVKNCKNLTYLDLSLNHLQKLPEGISQLVNLEELFLNDTYLEFLHANFGRLTKLKVLELRENSLQTLPKSMSRLHNLQRIDIGQNDLSELPEVIGTMTNLIEIWCDNNNVRSIPKFMGNLTKLNCLDASQNEIQEISEDIAKCAQLSDLTLANNSLESLPDSFSKLENLTVLRLDSNSIQYLPEDLGSLKSLQELSLIRNLLKSLPASVGLMRKLRTLYLDDNLLTELPKEIGSCSVLSILSVAKNRLGSIPSELGHLNNLKVLTLAGNLLVNLPVSLLNIRALDALWLSESQSKPLLPLTKEVDPTSGQHVLTCYLLPQLPSAQAEVTPLEDETLPPRRSRPSIKFMTDVEPPPVENNLSKRGLLRAPTPYPKELRALAKHASHLRSKDQNGDVIINDEPEYEGDFADDDQMQQALRDEVYRQQKGMNNGRVAYQQHSFQDVPVLPAKDYDMKIYDKDLEGHYGGSRTSSGPAAGPQTPLLPPISVETILSGHDETSNRSQTNLHPFQKHPTNISLIDPCPVVNETSPFLRSNNTEDLNSKKGPPPYHVAARRAAMFRSTASSSVAVTPSGSLGDSSSSSSQAADPQRWNSTRLTVIPVENEYQQRRPEPPPPPSLHCNPSSQENASVGQGEMTTRGDSHSVRMVDKDTADIPWTGSNSNNSTPAGRGDTVWDVGACRKEQQLQNVMNDNESRVIEEIIENSNAHNLQQRKNVGDPVARREETAVAGTQNSVVENTQPVMNYTSDVLDDKPVPGLISTIEMSLQSNRDIVDGQTVSGWNQDHPSLEANISQCIPQQLPCSEQAASSNNINDNNNVVNKGIKSESSMWVGTQAAGNNATTTKSTSTSCLSPSESFSKIPKFNLSKNTPPPTAAAKAGTVLDYKVPPSSAVTSSSKLHHMNSSGRSSSNTSSSSSNNSAASSSVNWSRIPKAPGIVTETVKKLESSSKPTLSRVSSGTKIPTVSTDMSKTASKPSMSRSTNLPISSPTGGSSRIPRLGDSCPQQPATPQQAEPQQEEKPVQEQYHQQLPNVGSQPFQDEGYYLNNFLPKSQSYQQQPEQRQQQQHPAPQETQQLERTLSGSRIPKYSDPPKYPGDVDSTKGKIFEANVPVTTWVDVPADSPSGGSKIPVVGGRKPWIFGTHRNARVVPVEFTKVNALGFTVTDGPIVSNVNEGSGIYVDSVDTGDSAVKVGDKILQVDGIDVSNMGIDIVRKILSNCQENIHLLVSRQY